MRKIVMIVMVSVLFVAAMCMTSCTQMKTAEKSTTTVYAEMPTDRAAAADVTVEPCRAAQTASFNQMNNETCYATLTEWGFDFGDEIDAAAAAGNYDGVEYYRIMAAAIEQNPDYVYAVTFRSFQPYRSDPAIAVMNNLLYEKLGLSFIQNYTRDGVTHEIRVTAFVDEETGHVRVTACDPADQAFVTPSGVVFVK